MLCFRAITSSRYSPCVLPERYLCASENQGGDEVSQPNRLVTIDKVGVLNQLQDERPRAETYARILGFTFNTKAMKASVPQSKLTKLTTRIKQLQEKAMYSCRWIARLLGKMILITPAICKALLYIRYLQRDPTKNLRQQHQNWEMTYSQSQESWKEMHWWLQRAAHLNGLPIILSQQPKESDVGIFDDAFDTG